MQVSVRRGALSAASSLSRELPHETPVAQLWVTAVLPLVRLLLQDWQPVTRSRAAMMAVLCF